jgi:hypothetical protein
VEGKRTIEANMANALTELWKTRAGRWIVGVLLLTALVVVLLRAL